MTTPTREPKTDGLYATSDEQHRLRKMIKGSTGTTDQDAVDEVFDNAIGENGLSVISLEFNKNKLELIFNDGTPMTRDDRQRYLTLDSRSKINIDKVAPKKRKGMHGIGEALSRGRLAGQGKQTTTTKTEDDVCHQVVIDLKGLTAENYNHHQCWTGATSRAGEKNTLRPMWKKIEDIAICEKYKTGVTKEYSGESLEQNFELNDTIFHIADKYERNINLGLKFNIKWDGKIYVVPPIYKQEMWEERKYTLTVYSDLIEWTMDSKRQTISKSENGTWRAYTSSKNNSNFESAEATPKGTLTFTVKIPKMRDTCPDGKGNPIMDWFNECLPDAFTNNISERDGKLYLNCGGNEVYKDLHEMVGRENHLTETLLDFNKGISISMDNMKLTHNDFDLALAIKSATHGDKFAAQSFRLDLNFNSDEEIIKPQENKNVLKVPQEVITALNAIVKHELQNIVKKIKKQRSTRDEVINMAAATKWLADAPARKAKKAKEMEAKKSKEMEAKKVNKKIDNKSLSAGEQKENTLKKSDNSKDKSTLVASFKRGVVTKIDFRKQVEIYLKNFKDDEVPAGGPYNQMQKDHPKQ